VTVGKRPAKAAMLVAHRIVRDIVRGGLRPGDLLPPERTMLADYDTGRGTLREALRLLEFQGVLTLKPGPRGGPVLLDPDASHLAGSLVLLMQLKQAPLRTIVEVRTALEPMISALAAGRIADPSVAELAGAVDAMRDRLGDQDAFLDADKRFHDVIAWSSGNALFGYLVDALLGVMHGTILGIDLPSARRAATLAAHEGILAAIRARDPAAAEARMRAHLDDYVRYAEQRFPEVLDEVIPWDPTPR
jgi:GntR family transcriptional regulator, transcriptional repressor for pyruvate dehydrogenase complex